MEAQKSLRVATLPMKYVIKLDKDENGRTRLSELEGQFMTTVLDAFGPNYEVVRPEDNQYGRREDDGNFTGMIGMVQRGEADLAFSILRMSIQRYEVVDFSKSYAMESMKFVIKKPGNITPVFAFLQPFDVRIWVGILIAIFVLSTMGKIFDRSSSWGRNFLQTVSSVLKQPLTMGDGSLKWMLLIGFWFLFTLVISASYSSALLSFLTVPLQGMAVENFQQLSRAVQMGTHKCYLLKGSTQVHSLQTSNRDNRILYDFAERNDWFYNSKDIGSDKFIDSNSVVVAGRLTSNLYFGFRKNKYLISKDVVAVIPVAIVISKNFCCKAKLNTILSRMEASGIYNKLLRDASLKVSLGMLDDNEQDTIRPLTVTDLSGCLIILLMGWALSLVVFVGEIIFYVLFKRKKNIKM